MCSAQKRQEGASATAEFLRSGTLGGRLADERLFGTEASHLLDLSRTMRCPFSLVQDEGRAPVSPLSAVWGAAIHRSVVADEAINVPRHRLPNFIREFRDGNKAY